MYGGETIDGKDGGEGKGREGNPAGGRITSDIPRGNNGRITPHSDR